MFSRAVRENKHIAGTYCSGHWSGWVEMRFPFCVSSVALWISTSGKQSAVHFVQGESWIECGDSVQMGLSKNKVQNWAEQSQSNLCFLASAAAQWSPWWFSYMVKSVFGIQSKKVAFVTRDNSFLAICSHSRTLTHCKSYSHNINVIFLNVQSAGFTLWKLRGLVE